MNIAWLGPPPRKDHGVPAVATLLLRSLAEQGMQIDCFTVARRDDLPGVLLDLPALRWVLQATAWQPDEWYSRSSASAFLTLRATRAAGQLRLGRSILRRHRQRPYDAIYQYSAPETFALGRDLAELPPLILHPQAHAAGELRWHRREDALAALRESSPRRAAVRAMLRARARAQSHAVSRAARIICASERFAHLLIEDYGARPEAMRVVPNPVDLDRFRPLPRQRTPDDPLRLLFVGMLAVRKGLEMIADLTHRLADERGRVTIEVAGEPRDWSNYSGLLDRLNPEVGKALGWVDPPRLSALYQEVDGVLQPSHYEPFGIAVAEALASGVPVVASSAVGAAEWASGPGCRTFAAGDRDQFETAVRALIGDVRSNRRDLSRAARESAAAFDPARVGRRLADMLSEAAA